MHRYGAAIAELTLLRAQQPGWAEAHAAYADACMRDGREAQALAGYDAVLELEPAHFAARASRALLLGHRGERESALASLEALDAESPRQPHVLNGIGLQLEALGRVREAAERFADAYAADPGLAAANANLANACLLLGDFARGWRHQGNKWRGGELKKHPRSFACPLWQGEPLEGRRLLVWSEQGLGDQIMYAGMFAELAAQGAVFESHPRLASLFARSFAPATVLARGDARLAAMPFDFHAPMSALGEYLRASWEAFPRHAGYLKPDAERRAAWRARLDGLGAGLKVGVSWRGGTAHTGGAARSSTLDDWRALLGLRGARFVSLQYGKCEPEVERLRAGGVALAHWPEAIDDFEECAALVSELDLVVSVTTTVVHLAGALGKPVWVLVPARPGWRYLLEGEAMPWYPSARLLRQSREGGWPAVISRAAGELAAALAARR
jgi:tetratricopeptide (TPR) repeat protein